MSLTQTMAFQTFFREWVITHPWNIRLHNKIPAIDQLYKQKSILIVVVTIVIMGSYFFFVNLWHVFMPCILIIIGAVCLLCEILGRSNILYQQESRILSVFLSFFSKEIGEMRFLPTYSTVPNSTSPRTRKICLREDNCFCWVITLYTSK